MSRVRQIIYCFVLVAFAARNAEARQIEKATANPGVTQQDPAKQKQTFWEQWTGAMAKGDSPRALGLVRADRTLAAAVANEVGNHGLTLFKSGKKVDALGVFHGLMPLYLQLDDEHGVAATAQNIGSAYSATGDCKSAMSAFGRAAQGYERIKYQPGRESAGKGLGICVWAVAIPDTSLGGIVNLKVTRDASSVIVVHPARCRQIGVDACEFYLVHEYAHLYMGHVAQNKPWEEGEIEADCWAAKYGRRASAMAAYDWFLKAPAGISPRGHKSNELRAERIRACARF